MKREGKGLITHLHAELPPLWLSCNRDNHSVSTCDAAVIYYLWYKSSMHASFQISCEVLLKNHIAIGTRPA